MFSLSVPPGGKLTYYTPLSERLQERQGETTSKEKTARASSHISDVITTKANIFSRDMLPIAREGTLSPKAPSPRVLSPRVPTLSPRETTLSPPRSPRETTLSPRDTTLSPPRSPRESAVSPRDTTLSPPRSPRESIISPKEDAPILEFGLHFKKPVPSSVASVQPREVTRSKVTQKGEVTPSSTTVTPSVFQGRESGSATPIENKDESVTMATKLSSGIPQRKEVGITSSVMSPPQQSAEKGVTLTKTTGLNRGMLPLGLLIPGKTVIPGSGSPFKSGEATSPTKLTGRVTPSKVLPGMATIPTSTQPAIKSPPKSQRGKIPSPILTRGVTQTPSLSPTKVTGPSAILGSTYTKSTTPSSIPSPSPTKRTMSSPVLSRGTSIPSPTLSRGVIYPRALPSPSFQRKAQGQPNISSPSAIIKKSEPAKVSPKDSEKQKKKLNREDSFNRTDSPIRELMPLPKESVIARNRSRRQKYEESSSSDSSPTSPRASPRQPRRHHRHGGHGSAESAYLSPPGRRRWVTFIMSYLLL